MIYSQKNMYPQGVFGTAEYMTQVPGRSDVSALPDFMQNSGENQTFPNFMCDSGEFPNFLNVARGLYPDDLRNEMPNFMYENLGTDSEMANIGYYTHPHARNNSLKKIQLTNIEPAEDLSLLESLDSWNAASRKDRATVYKKVLNNLLKDDGSWVFWGEITSFYRYQIVANCSRCDILSCKENGCKGCKSKSLEVTVNTDASILGIDCVDCGLSYEVYGGKDLSCEECGGSLSYAREFAGSNYIGAFFNKRLIMDFHLIPGNKGLRHKSMGVGHACYFPEEECDCALGTKVVAPFLITRTPITEGQALKYSKPNINGFCVNPYLSVDEYLPFLSESSDHVMEWLDCMGMRLPTAHEWRFACLGGANADYPWGTLSADPLKPPLIDGNPDTVVLRVNKEIERANKEEIIKLRSYLLTTPIEIQALIQNKINELTLGGSSLEAVKVIQNILSQQWYRNGFDLFGMLGNVKEYVTIKSEDVEKSNFLNHIDACKSWWPSDKTRIAKIFLKFLHLDPAERVARVLEKLGNNFRCESFEQEQARRKETVRSFMEARSKNPIINMIVEDKNEGRYGEWVQNFIRDNGPFESEEDYLKELVNELSDAANALVLKGQPTKTEIVGASIWTSADHITGARNFFLAKNSTSPSPDVGFRAVIEVRDGKAGNGPAEKPRLNFTYASAEFAQQFAYGIENYQDPVVWAEKAVHMLTERGRAAIIAIDSTENPAFMSLAYSFGIDPNSILYQDALSVAWIAKAFNALGDAIVSEYPEDGGFMK